YTPHIYLDLFGFFFLLLLPPPRTTIFPYTTLFRSRPTVSVPRTSMRAGSIRVTPSSIRRRAMLPWWMRSSSASCSLLLTPRVSRSEEHTSELQSRENLVCRLLLEKKKKFQ